MIRILKLNPTENTLIGEYNDGDTVMCECDATTEDFTIVFPDVLSVENATFKMNRKDEVYANNITLSVLIPGQKIQNEDTQILRVGDSFEITPGAEHWWVT